MEIIRINYNDGNPTIVPKAKCQNKVNRYYFTKTIVLFHEELFVSPLDLNMENGEIEQPIKPMIRFATPVFDKTGKRRGIVILNFFAQRILQHIKGKTMLINQEGYWLKGGEPENIWGFMYKNNKTFSLQYPEIWDLMNNTPEGIYKKDKMLVSYITLSPFSAIEQEQSHLQNKDIIKTKGSRYFWKLVMMSVESTNIMRVELLFKNYLIICSILSLLFMFISLVLVNKMFDRRTSIIIELEQKKLEIQKALSEVKELSGMLPICASCKNVRDDNGYWNQIEDYIRNRTDVDFSHSVCPQCMVKLYPDFIDHDDPKK